MRDQEVSPSDEKSGQPTVLIAEDERGLRTLLRQLLESCPCRVYDVGSGEEALELAAKLDEVDLLITDVVMAGIDGFELAEQLAENNPDLEVLFMSGYTDRDTSSTSADGDRRRFIQKPFDPDTMYDLVEELLLDIDENEAKSSNPEAKRGVRACAPLRRTRSRRVVQRQAGGRALKFRSAPTTVGYAHAHFGTTPRLSGRMKSGYGKRGVMQRVRFQC